MQRRILTAGLLFAPIAAASLIRPALAQITPAQAVAADQRAVLHHYADLAQAMYGDSLLGLQKLQRAVETFLAAPSETGLQAARAAWLAARTPYSQTEGFRFGNPEVDEWEGRINSWPLDEGLIDYVDPSYGTERDENPLYTANIIATRGTLNVAGKAHDLTTLTPEAIEGLHVAGEVEANVTIGYHAIEFLLWGQDLHGTGPGAGERPFTDYTTAANADRRGQYLRIVTGLLVKDMADMVAKWAPGGEIRQRLAAQPASQGIGGALTGLGSLSYGELAGERMKLGLLLHDPEEEHDCFSDNTHNSHRGNVLGMIAIWRGEYTRTDGRVLRGASLRNLADRADSRLRAELDTRFATTLAAFDRMKQRAETVERYDQMLADGNKDGNATIQAGIDGLIAQTRALERVVASLKLPALTVEGSDSLDDPSKVFK